MTQSTLFMMSFGTRRSNLRIKSRMGTARVYADGLLLELAEVFRMQLVHNHVALNS